MALIVNGTEIENIIVIEEESGKVVELDKFQDENGNIIWEKSKLIDVPNTALVYMAYDSNGNQKYLVASGTSVSGTTYYYQTPYADTYAIATIGEGTTLSGNDMATGGPFYTLNPAYNGTPSYYAIGGSSGTVDTAGVNLWSPIAYARTTDARKEFVASSGVQNGLLVLPSTFNGKPIKKISHGAFSIPDAGFTADELASNPEITETETYVQNFYIYTILPDTIEEILNKNTGGLRFVNIPKSLRVIGGYNSGWLRDGYFKLEVPRTVTRLYRESFGNSPSELYFLHSPTDTIVFPTAGQNTGAFYNKTARTMTIYTDNPTIKNYDYSADNVTATIYHLDGSAWE